jgi:hypothetical protein
MVWLRLMVWLRVWVRVWVRVAVWLRDGVVMKRREAGRGLPVLFWGSTGSVSDPFIGPATAYAPWKAHVPVAMPDALTSSVMTGGVALPSVPEPCNTAGQSNYAQGSARVSMRGMRLGPSAARPPLTPKLNQITHIPLTPEPATSANVSTEKRQFCEAASCGVSVVRHTDPSAVAVIGSCDHGEPFEERG